MSSATERQAAIALIRPATRLALATIAHQLGVTFGDIGRALGISAPSAGTLARYGWYPRRLDPEVVRGCVRDLLAHRGATDHQLRVMFEPESDTCGTGPARALPDPRRPKTTPFTGPLPMDQLMDADVLTAKSVMSPATGKFFKLFRNPFDGAVESDQQLFVSAEFGFLRELAWQTAVGGTFTALVGESGAGKTTLLEDLESRLMNASRGVVLFKPAVVGMEENNRSGHMLKSADLLHSIISTLDASANVPATLQARTLLATRLMVASVRAGNAHLLAVEEAHRMPESTMRHLKRLHELREGRRPLLGILLLGQPELQRRLADGLRNGTLREVAQRCEVAILPPLGDDLRGYLDCRAAACGRDLATIVDLAAVPAIAEKLTAKVGQQRVPMSYPLAVNNLVTRAMNLAAHIGAPLVTADVVRAA